MDLLHEEGNKNNLGKFNVKQRHALPMTEEPDILGRNLTNAVLALVLMITGASFKYH